MLFNAMMVRAILEDRKTQTRRICKIDPLDGFDNPNCAENLALCPYGVAGDRLWVREAWARESDLIAYDKGGNPIFYRADHPTGLFHDSMEPMHWRPSIHMPRWASRITLEITKVRVERLQDISEEDAIAEGVGHNFVMNGGWPDYQHIDKSGHCTLTQDSAKMSYATLWDSINGKGAWDANPWVWVIEFKREKA